MGEITLSNGQATSDSQMDVCFVWRPELMPLARKTSHFQARLAAPSILAIKRTNGRLSDGGALCQACPFGKIHPYTCCMTGWSCSSCIARFGRPGGHPSQNHRPARDNCINIFRTICLSISAYGYRHKGGPRKGSKGLRTELFHMPDQR